MSRRFGWGVCTAQQSSPHLPGSPAPSCESRRRRRTRLRRMRDRYCCPRCSVRSAIHAQGSGSGSQTAPPPAVPTAPYFRSMVRSPAARTVDRISTRSFCVICTSASRRKRRWRTGGGEEAAQSVEQGGELEQVERRHITRALEECGWAVEGARGAAQRLGLDPSTLRYRMKKLGVRRQRR